MTRHRIPFADDPSNADARHVRVRVRQQLVPLLEALSPHIVEHLCALADDILALDAADGPDGPLDRAPPQTYTLPRRTALALAQLQDTRAPSARILLPGGLVATVAVPDDQPHLAQPENMVPVKGQGYFRRFPRST
jgi:tRNA(Ile)-lysidine synthase